MGGGRAAEVGELTWPFAGRSAELATGRAGLREHQGVAVFGATGAGATRLAAEVRAEVAPSDGWHRVVGSRGMADVPFGAWAHLAPAGLDRLDDAVAWRALADGLREADGAIRLSVEDAHWLDPGSAALLHHLVATHQACAVVTSRRDRRPAQPITALWKDGHLARIDLELLGPDDLEQLLEAALGAPVEPRTVHRLHERTLGNLVLVRELVEEARRTGALRLVHGAWVQDGADPLGPRLVDLLTDRIDELSDDERDLTEVLAVTGPVPADLLPAVVAPSAIPLRFHTGPVRSVPVGSRQQLRAAEPLVAEVLLARMAPDRREAILRAAVVAYEGAADLHDHDAFQLERWRVELGVEVDPAAAIRAADSAIAHRDFVTGEQLAAAAAEAGGGAPAAIRLGEALMNQQRHLAADQVLAPVGEHLADLDDDLRFRYANARALSLSTEMGRLDDAISVLQGTIPTMADDRSRWALEAHLAFLLADCGRLAAARPLAEARLANVANDEPSALTALIAGGLIRTLGGRCQDTLDLCDELLPVALRNLDERPDALGWIAAAQMLATYVRGDLQVAEELGDAVDLLVADEPDPTLRAAVLMSRGLVQSDRGRLDVALRLLQQAAALHEVDNRRGYQAWCFAITARVHAQRGEVAEAREALAAARSHLWPGGQAFSGDLDVAAVWVAMLEGDREGAVIELEVALARMEAEGMTTSTIGLRHEAVRAGLPPGPHVEAMAVAAAAEQSRWGRAQAEHVAALAAEDGAALVAVGHRFAELGVHLQAAEAFVQAAGVHRAAGSTTLAVQAKQLGEAQRSRCERAATPILRFGDGLVGLTAREMDIAVRAAAGESNHEIAAALDISVRTAETHLQRAFAKLGVHRRSDLAAFFDPVNPG